MPSSSERTRRRIRPAVQRPVGPIAEAGQRQGPGPDIRWIRLSRLECGTLGASYHYSRQDLDTLRAEEALPSPKFPLASRVAEGADVLSVLESNVRMLVHMHRAIFHYSEVMVAPVKDIKGAGPGFIVSTPEFRTDKYRYQPPEFRVIPAYTSGVRPWTDRDIVSGAIFRPGNGDSNSMDEYIRRHRSDFEEALTAGKVVGLRLLH